MAIHTSFRAAKLALLLLFLGMIFAKANNNDTDYCVASHKLCLERCGEEIAFECVDDGPGAQAVTCACSSSVVETGCIAGNCTASGVVVSVTTNASGRCLN